MYQCSIPIAGSPYFAEYCDKLYYSTHEGLWEINPDSYSYRKILPDGQVSSYCVVDREGVCVYVMEDNARTDSRIKLPSGRIIKVSSMTVDDILLNYLSSEPDSWNKNDWFEHNGCIYRLVSGSVPEDVASRITAKGSVSTWGGQGTYAHVTGIYKYIQNGNSVDVERVCSCIDYKYGSDNGPSLFIKDSSSGIIYALRRYSIGETYMLCFDGREIKNRSFSYSADMDEIAKALGMMALRYDNGPNGSMHYAKKTLVVDSDPVFFTENAIYRLHRSKFWLSKAPLNLSDEYDVYEIAQTDGSNTAEFSGMKFADGAIVLGSIDSQGTVTIVGETASSYGYSYMLKIN